MMAEIPFETFAPLSAIPFLRHAFSRRTAHDTRHPDFPVQFARQLGYERFATAEQPHGNAVAIVTDSSFIPPHSSLPAVDALITAERNLPLVVRCADCAPVFLVDPITPALGLIHSGKKGTLANITGNTLAAMHRHFGTAPEDVVSFIGPRIGPCHYEMDIGSAIEEQLRQAGVGQIHHPRICTACHLDRYYSYRAEKGQTGRHFALAALA